jgi:triacylglycerol esterase/lipase EstA (alpha/beta hydrolase family)
VAQVSPRRRLLLAVVAVLALLAAVALVVPRLGSDPAARVAAPQDRPGPVLLVPGYGGSTAGLEVLARRLREAGREAVVVPAPGDGTGDLRETAEALGEVAERLLGEGAPSVDLVGYSAGGVVTRLWAQDAADRVRRVVTLGSPHHGSRLAASGALFAPGACPVACQQLVPESQLLSDLNDGDETPDGPQWLSLWTVQDETVTPPESARLEGAVNVVLQDVCPGLAVSHSALPTEPLVAGIVLQALSSQPVAPPTDCAALSAAGR